MANLIWSIALALVGITGLWLAGSQRRVGWALGLAAQAAWLVFGLVSGQYGFVLSAIAYGFVYARNFRRQSVRTMHVRIKVDTRHVAAALEQAREHVRRSGRA